jgi:hypothetical protein
LHWGWLDGLEAAQDGAAPPAWEYDSLAVANPFNAAYPVARAVSDLYLDAAGNLWTASAFDPDADSGPFVSAVWAAAFVNADDETPVTDAGLATDSWLLEGLKIEALSSPCTPGGVLSFATDDEGYGGIWRPLGAPTDFQGGSSITSEETEEDVLQ